jgi:hypothetical protein
MTAFTLRDNENVLTPEDFQHINLALSRANTFPWFGRPWIIYGPDGRPAYSHRYPKETP